MSDDHLYLSPEDLEEGDLVIGEDSSSSGHDSSSQTSDEGEDLNNDVNEEDAEDDSDEGRKSLMDGVKLGSHFFLVGGGVKDRNLWSLRSSVNFFSLLLVFINCACVDHAFEIIYRSSRV